MHGKKNIPVKKPKSEGFIGLASILIRTWPDAGWGTGTSFTSKACDAAFKITALIILGIDGCIIKKYFEEN